MADAICRWRNPYLSTVIELIKILPKEELSKEKARQIVVSNSPYDFYRTPYQLASQLGLYHETNGRYFPKFAYMPKDDEVLDYLKNWLIHYCVPNPYTNGFDKLKPFSIHSKLCNKLLQERSSLNYDDLLFDIFEEHIGNKDILANSIKSYSTIITIENRIVRLKDNKTYEDLVPFIKVDINNDRYNKEYFFDLFATSKNYIYNSSSEQIQAFTNDIELIKQVQNLTNLTQTEKNQIVAARVGQGFFRRNLIIDCKFCPITLVNETSLLVASHIKPWRASDNIERLNHKNGFLLTPTFDKLFDKGIISFTNEKRLLVSTSISTENKLHLNLIEEAHYPLLPTIGREEFLEYHRRNVFMP